MSEQQPSRLSGDSRCESLPDLLDARAQEHAEKLAYQFLIDGDQPGSSLTFAELRNRCLRLSQCLANAASPGDRALLLYPAGTDFVVAFLSCLRAGIVAVPLPPPDLARAHRSLPRLRSVVRDADASLVLTTDAIRSEIEKRLDSDALGEVADDLRQLHWMNTPDVDLSAVPETDLPVLSADDLAFLQYTSGSTSAPKGVMVTHGNLVHQCEVLGEASGYSDASVALTWMPYHHDYGLVEGLLVPMSVGATCYIMSPVSFIKRPIRWLRAITDFGVTHSQAPNFAHELCVRKTKPKDRAGLDLSTWKVAASAAEPVRPVTLNEFHEAFHDCGLKWNSLSPAYGLAEATLIATHSRPDEPPRFLNVDASAWERGQLVSVALGEASLHPQHAESARRIEHCLHITSCGRPLRDMRVVIVDPETRRLCGEGHVGEIWLAGPSIAVGYWKQSGATEDTFAARVAESEDGPFLRTGDLGCLQDGELFVCGRAKDLIIIRGLNHYPQDIELTTERSHPTLRPGYGAAFSVDVDGDERLVIVQEVEGRHRRSLDAEAVLSAIRKAVLEEHDLSPHAIVLVGAGGVLKTTSGKIQRRAMKAAFEAGELEPLGIWKAGTSSLTSSKGKKADEGRLSDGAVQAKEKTIGASEIAAWLTNWLNAHEDTLENVVDPDTAFADCGLDSLLAAELAADLDSWLGVPVEATVFWRCPTVRLLSEYLASEPGITKLLSSRTPEPISDSPVSRSDGVSDDDIVIVGMGCRFPGGVDSPDSFWQLLSTGTDAVGEIPPDRWDIDSLFDSDPDADGRMYVRHGGFIDHVDEFDAAFFGISPREAEELDPQQRLLLEVMWQSLEHGGITASSLRGTDTGVFVGISSDDFATTAGAGNDLSAATAQNALGTARSLAAGRVSYVLGLHGPALQIDTACSSSLVAVHQACQSLRSGECSMALAGGVNLMLSPAMTVALCRLKALAADGRCKAFDASADGTVRGEGCGMVVLKRMADAVRDGDRILARICATAVNHDGASNGLTAPNPVAQEKLIERALGNSDLQPADISYVEAHGTGTPLGDPIELSALDATYGQQRSETQPLYVGTAKTSIGHLEAAAGIAGLIRTVLILEHGQVPASLHFENPNPEFEWRKSRVRVATELTPWPETGDVRRAAVSSFGCSGTNAHAILQGMSREAQQLRSNSPRESGAQILILSARSAASLNALARRYHQHVASHPELSLRDVCFSAATGRSEFAHRLAVVARSREELLSELEAWLNDGAASQVVVGKGRRTISQVAFLFTGQGSQYVGMGRELYETEPVFRRALDRCVSVSNTLLDVPLNDVLFTDGSSSSALIDQTEYTQPALFAIEYALAELWQSWGITPCGVLGHSLGEYAAACVAGVFDVETGASLVAERGQLIEALPGTGQMAVVLAGESTVNAAINGHRVSIAAVNGPSSLVISGVREDVHAVTAQLNSEGVDTELLNTSNAGHSPLMDPVLEPFRQTATGYQFQIPTIPLVSNVSGGFAGNEIADGGYWATHIRSPVRFADGMRTLASTGCEAFIEIGPEPSLLSMGMASIKDRKRRWLPSLASGRSDRETMLYSLAELYVRGFDVDWNVFYSHGDCRRVELPTYAFQRQRFPVPNSGRALPPRAEQNSTVESEIAVSPARMPSHPQARDRAAFPAAQVIEREVEPQTVGLEDATRELTPRLNEVAIGFVVEALTELGFDWYPGSEFDDLAFSLKLPEANRVKSDRVLSRLVECGLLERRDRSYVVTKAVVKEGAAQRLDELNRKSPSAEGELLGRAGPQLAAIWRGDVEPLTVLFPTGETDEAVDFYSNSHLLAGYNRLAGEAVSRAIQRVPDDASLRFLEVGAGTGGLTAFLLPQLSNHRAEYVFTDVSQHFLRKAEDRFAEYSCLKTELLDASLPVENQGFSRGTFDMVVAANVLHATPRLHETLGHVRSLLRPGGLLLLLECANPPLWGDMIFTLIDGWWNFQDTELRPDYPLMQPDRWKRTLMECGFADVSCLNDRESGDDSFHTLYLAQADDGVPVEHQAVSSLPDVPSVERPAQESTRPANVPLPVPTLPEGMTEEEMRDLVRTHAAQVMRMNPEEIDDHEPLADLGMDSLMAVELRTHLEHVLGVELSLNPLRMRRSVDEIAAYAFEDHVQVELPTEETGESLANERLNAPRAHVVPLTPTDRSLEPLFFVPAGYGDLVAFQEIANALGNDQPVYGLQPASAKRVKTIRQMSIYRLVSAYMSEIRKVQPHGPYQLTGYSAGAFIALELARELQRQGEEVSLLVIIDPPTKVPFWLDWMYECGYRFFKFTRLLNVVRRVRSRYVRRLFHTVLDEGLRTHTTVTSGHRVEPYDGHLTYFRSRLSQASLVSLRPVDSFWRRIAQGGLEIHWIPGTHYGMMREAGAKVIVDELADCLHRAQSAVRAEQED